MRQLAWLCGLVLLVSACTDAPKPPVGEGQALVGGVVINVTQIPEPDSARAWVAEALSCIGRGGEYPEGLTWFVGDLPTKPEVLGGLADLEARRVYLAPSVAYASDRLTYRVVVTHEVIHHVFGWKALHPPIHPLGISDHTEPRAYYSRKCGTA